MKLHHIAAAALLIGTSAFAFAPDAEPMADTAQAGAPAGNPDLDLALDPNAPDPEAADTGIADTDTAGVGGPIEAAQTAQVTNAAADPTPHPATQNYPPCDPGPGDDSCIQLYEPGVRMALASWNQPTGGLIQPGEAATAMGGPYEPVEDGTAETAMNGDGVVDTAVGETGDAEVAQSGEFTGVGGPIAETGYPPCDPGPGDDRCIQVYEPGVTGAGN